jgi:hypothetical protein
MEYECVQYIYYLDSSNAIDKLELVKKHQEENTKLTESKFQIVDQIGD